MDSLRTHIGTIALSTHMRPMDDHHRTNGGVGLGVFDIENIASIDISINIGKLILKVDIEGR